jgi:prevent-host-death family protein
LKAKLSAYLAAVRKGETVVVYDRKTPVARLIPYAQAPDELGIEEPVITDPAPAWPQPVQLRKKIDVVKLLREDRDQR